MIVLRNFIIIIYNYFFNLITLQCLIIIVEPLLLLYESELHNFQDVRI